MNSSPNIAISISSRRTAIQARLAPIIWSAHDVGCPGGVDNVPALQARADLAGRIAAAVPPIDVGRTG